MYKRQDPLFAVVVYLYLFVMYEAAGVRHAAGRQARVLNVIIDTIYDERKVPPAEKLRELVGHTPLEVLMGSILGFVFVFAVWW